MVLTANNTEFRTTETPLASYLILEGYNLITIEYEPLPNSKRRATFVFENDSPRLKDLVSLYNRGEAIVNIVMYEHTRSALLDRIMRGLP